MLSNFKMGNTIPTIVYQISHARPMSMLFIRVISELKVNYNYLSDLEGKQLL